MAVNTETKVSVAEVDEFMAAHPQTKWPLEERARRETALRLLVLERFPQWSDKHTITCDFRGMDQEFHVLNETLRLRAMEVMEVMEVMEIKDSRDSSDPSEAGHKS